ncbi:PEP-CTERM sorting domain-containing protein [Ideonella livida]|uniref:PEP-CTERM sorting domain-containing protein n=1 Tax=Ideonella livida TaxID=2707176 RepID=A0A7C9TP76_9BURK|nr:PEP-CTERM sorting domain-containing protein [Ideonella livida]NDY93406.1 PEP-CTERM sorting domain-containing protein [Ideonella livida]
MRFLSARACGALALALSLAPAAALAAPAFNSGTWTFTQDRWLDGGTATLSFTGADSDRDGLLELGELTAFSIDHDRLATLDRFNILRAFGLSDLTRFSWDMGDSTTFGDNATDSFSAEYLYGSGGWMARIFGYDEGGFESGYWVGSVERDDYASGPYTAAAVPEPASAALMLGGLAALAWRRRRN